MNSIIVVDNGLYEVRGGFSGDCAPRSKFLNQIGHVKHLTPVFAAKSSKECFTGKFYI